MATAQAEAMTGTAMVTVTVMTGAAMVMADAVMASWSCQCRGGGSCFKVWGG
jgi:hypothetical protein